MEVIMAFKSLLPSVFSGEGSRDPFHDLQRQIDRVFSDFSRDLKPVGMGRNGSFSPSIDVCETDKALEVTAELPGVDEKDIDVTLADDMLTIRAEKKSEKEEKDEKKNYHLVERSYGTFERRMSLPFRADPSKVDAKFEKGVLKLTVPKPAEAQAKVQKIQVSGGK
jgi:HSP20 family protein